MALPRAFFHIIIDFREYSLILESMNPFMYLSAIIMKSKILLCLIFFAHVFLGATPVAAGIEPRWKVAGTGKFGSFTPKLDRKSVV